MGPSDVYTRTELARIRDACWSGSIPDCPRCEVGLESRPVPRPPTVSYVRHRIWLLCPGCGRSAVLDQTRD